jgi:hypothetical protein
MYIWLTDNQYKTSYSLDTAKQLSTADKQNHLRNYNQSYYPTWFCLQHELTTKRNPRQQPSLQKNISGAEHFGA